MTHGRLFASRKMVCSIAGTHVKSAGQVDALNARERKIMTAGFLRYMALMVHLNLLETLSEIRKEEA